MTGDDAHLPDAGSVEVAAPDETAELVEEIAHGEVGSPGLMIVLDIDGTVILADETPSPGVVDAVGDAVAAGHEVMIATGRSWAGTRGILRVLGLAPDYVVCSNGAVVLKLVDADDLAYERVHVETFDAHEVLTMLVKHFPDAHYMVELPDGERLYTEEFVDWHLHDARRVPFDQLAQQPVSRVVVVAPDHDTDAFSEVVGQIGLTQVSYAIGWSAWLDIAPNGVDKGTALELVRQWRQVQPADVLVIGDGRNDLGMFQWALENGGRAVGMAQGPQEVLDAAGEITLSVEEGGVADVLRRLA